MGPARKKALMRTFRSIEDIIAATPEELAAIPEIPARQAQEIWDFLHPGQKPGGPSGEEQNPGREGQERQAEEE